MTSGALSASAIMRDPTPSESQWLALGPCAHVFDDLVRLGFSWSSRYIHPDIHPDRSKEIAVERDVMKHMVKHGIPNLDRLGHDAKQFVSGARMSFVDPTAYNDAKAQTPELVTCMATDETIVDTLTKRGVRFEDECIYLLGASPSAKEILVEGVHYASSLEQLRTMLRTTDSWLAPGCSPVGLRRVGETSASEKLLVQLWAACSPEPLPRFKRESSFASHHATISVSPSNRDRALTIKADGIEVIENVSRRRVSVDDNDDDDDPAEENQDNTIDRADQQPAESRPSSGSSAKYMKLADQKYKRLNEMNKAKALKYKGKATKYKAQAKTNEVRADRYKKKYLRLKALLESSQSQNTSSGMPN